jgi:hypothetical protein
MGRCYAQRRVQLRRTGSQQRDGLLAHTARRSRADAEPGGQRGEGLAVVRVGQDQQRLPPAVQRAPARADHLAVTADHPGQVGQCRARQRQSSTVESIEAPGQTKGLW